MPVSTPYHTLIDKDDLTHCSSTSFVLLVGLTIYLLTIYFTTLGIFYQGMDVVEKAFESYSVNGQPILPITVTDCGSLDQLSTV